MDRLRAGRPCAACTARDLHIASLKEELRAADRRTEDLMLRLTALPPPALPAAAPVSQLRTIPRQQGIASRIRRAERLDREEAEPLVAQRKKEYEARIADLIRPEVEVAGEPFDAIHENGTGQIQEPLGSDVQ
jgi:hypothetical protein